MFSRPFLFGSFVQFLSRFSICSSYNGFPTYLLLWEIFPRFRFGCSDGSFQAIFRFESFPAFPFSRLFWRFPSLSIFGLFPPFFFRFPLFLFGSFPPHFELTVRVVFILVPIYDRGRVVGKWLEKVVTSNSRIRLDFLDPLGKKEKKRHGDIHE